jgi:parallel beta-helix repeat protein
MPGAKVDISKQNWGLLINEFNKNNEKVEGFQNTIEDHAAQLADMTTNVNKYPIQTPEADDTARIQRALDDSSGKTLLFPFGYTYTIGKVNLNDNQKLLILGNIQANSTVSDSLFYGTDKNNISIFANKTGVATGNATNTLSGVVLNNCNNFMVFGLTLKSFKNKGIAISGTSTGGLILSNDISGSNGTTGAGISINGASLKKITISTNLISGSRIGIALNGGNDYIVIGNQCYDNVLAGIMLDGIVSATGDGTKNSIVSGNIITGCTDANYGGIYLGNGASFNTISNNQSNNNARSGIRTSGGTGYEPKGNKFIGNTVKNNAYHGFELGYGIQSTISENTVEGNTQRGITGSYSDESTISLNQIRNNGMQGVLWQSGKSFITKNKSKNNDKGIEIAFGGSTPTGNILDYNECENNTTSQMINAGTNTYRNNIGYVSENSGVSTQNGDGTKTAFTIAHGLSGTPKTAIVIPNSVNSLGQYYVTFDATNITVTYQTAPANVVNGVKLIWRAEL